jgi:predicted MPP superfamily phosphohydrolase
MNLAWLTDIHLNFLDAEERKKFYQEIINTKCDGVLISGDIAEAPSIKNILKELATSIQKPIYYILGNHDYYRGQVDAVRNEMTVLTESNEYLFWLPASKVMQLDNNTLLVGQDGWADGRLGDYHNSRVALNDSRMISDLFQEKLVGRSQLLAKMQQLADYDASQLKEQLIRAAIQRPQRIIVLTHIPPFKEACLHEGKISNDDWLPYFASKASGEVMTNICINYSDIDFLLLCGHTHGKATYHPFPNLIVEAGHAEYNKPEIQRIISFE